MSSLQECCFLFVNFSKAFDSIHRGKWEQILQAPWETVETIMMLYHPHHVVPLARISLTLSRHSSLSFISSGRSSGLHPVSSDSCYMYVRVGRPAFAWPYAGVHRSTSLISPSLLLQQCPACLVMLYKNSKVKDRSLDGDKDFFDIGAGVQKGDTLVPNQFIICQDCVGR